jgi:parvulin-like peptidyl-prolyl isomerase
MAKRAKQQEVLSRKQLSRREREERQKRILYVLAAVTAFAVIAVLGYGLYQEYIAKPSSPVAIVSGKVVSTRDYQQMVRYRRFELANQIGMLQTQLSSLDPTKEDEQFLVQYFQQQIQQAQNQALALPTQVLDDMIADEFVLQEAARRNIVVTPDEVQEEIEKVFGYERNPPTPTPTPTVLAGTETPTPAPTVELMTRDQFDKNYTDYVLALRSQAGIGEDAFRRLFELSVYRTKLQEALAEEVPATGEQVHARHILVETEEEAQEVLSRLEAGEDFAALANELSQDPGSVDGDLGWFSRGQMVPEFEEAAFSLQPGSTSDPVQTTYGFHIIQVLERDENRPLDEPALEQRKSTALSDWLAEQTQSEAVQRFWSFDKVPPTQ